MQHALIGVGQPVAADVAAVMGDRALVHQHIVMVVAHLRLEGVQVEAGLDHQDIVGVEDQGIVDVRDLAQALQCKAAVVGKVTPGLVDDLTPDAVLVEKIADDLLRAVGRTGIDDENVIDQRQRARKTPADELRLVFDDHAKTDGVATVGHSYDPESIDEL